LVEPCEEAARQLINARQVGTMFRLIAVLSAAVAAALMVAAPAQADDQSFLDNLQRNNVGTGMPGVSNPATTGALGHFMCERIRGGMSPADAAQLPRGVGVDGMGIVNAAQHELCPDTLH
jgi:hypothetical protein